MSITAKQRAAIPADKFAGPNRTYPVNTPGRADAAKGRATDAVAAGRMSKPEEKKIDTKANKELRK